MSLPISSYPWYALSVKHHHEKAVALALEGKGIVRFLPLHERIESGAQVPVFPSYVFCSLDILHRLPVLTIPGVSSFVSFGRGPVEISERELESVETMIESQMKIEPYPFLCSGVEVFIDRGPLKGLQGILVANKGHARLVVTVPMLQRSVAVEIDRAWVRPIAQPVKAAA